MNKPVLFALGGICFAAAAIMYTVGSTNSHLTELKDFFWVPLPLGAMFEVMGLIRK